MVVYLTSSILLDYSQIENNTFAIESTPLLQRLLKEETLYTDNIRLNLLYMAEHIGDTIENTSEKIHEVLSNCNDIKKLLDQVCKNTVSENEYEFTTLITRALTSITSKTELINLRGNFGLLANRPIWLISREKTL